MDAKKISDLENAIYEMAMELSQPAINLNHSMYTERVEALKVLIDILDFLRQ